jgi:hypothetical protein
MLLLDTGVAQNFFTNPWLEQLADFCSRVTQTTPNGQHRRDYEIATQFFIWGRIFFTKQTS